MVGCFFSGFLQGGREKACLCNSILLNFLLFLKSSGTKHDGFVINPENTFSVIPVKTEIQFFRQLFGPWIPAFAGMTTFYEPIKHTEQKTRPRRGRRERVSLPH